MKLSYQYAPCVESEGIACIATILGGGLVFKYLDGKYLTPRGGMTLECAKGILSDLSVPFETVGRDDLCQVPMLFLYEKKMCVIFRKNSINKFVIFVPSVGVQLIERLETNSISEQGIRLTHNEQHDDFKGRSDGERIFYTLNPAFAVDAQSLIAQERKRPEGTLYRQGVKRVSSFFVSTLSVDVLKKLHVDLFANIDPHAGVFRDVSTSRGNSVFVLPCLIERYLVEVEKNYNTDSRLTHYNTHDWWLAIAEYASDLNTIHPFINGNGRVIHELIKLVSESRGGVFEIYSRATKPEINFAYRVAGFGNLGPLIDLFKNVS